MLDKKKLLDLYPEFDQMYGPYLREDGRKHIILYGRDENRRECRRVVSYPKAILEIKIGRKLTGDETADHIDSDKSNDDPTNLQVLSLSENARKGAVGNTHCLGYRQSESQKRTGSKNGQAKLTDLQVANYRSKVKSGDLSKFDIMEITGLCEKSVRDFLTGKSYSNVQFSTPLTSLRGCKIK